MNVRVFVGIVLTTNSGEDYAAADFLSSVQGRGDVREDLNALVLHKQRVYLSSSLPFWIGRNFPLTSSPRIASVKRSNYAFCV